MNKYSGRSPLIDLPDTYYSLGESFTAYMEQLVPGMEIKNRHQCLAIVAIGAKSGMLQHPVNLFAQQWNTARTVGIKLRGIEPKETHLANRLPGIIVALNHYIIRVHISMHPRALGGFGYSQKVITLIQPTNAWT